MTLPIFANTIVPTFAAASFMLTAMALPPAVAQEVKPGTIAVSATGTANAEPDLATLSVSVQREAETARAALDANNEAMAFVLSSFREAGIEDRDLQTSGFNIQPRYFYPKPSKDGQQEPPRIVGYTVRNGLTVRVRDLTRLGDILDRSVTMGVNTGGNIAFGSSNPQPFIKAARANAMKQAIAKATTLTDTAGVQLGRILEISETSGRRPSPRPMARMTAASDEAATVPIAAGENSYNVSITVRWELQQ